MVIKALIFDLDDTILDSGYAIVQHHIKIAKLLGKRVPSEEEISRVLGIPWKKSLQIIWNEDNSEFINAYLATPKDNKIRVIPGAIEALQKLNEKYKLGLLTGRHRESVVEYLKIFQFPDLFFKIAAGSDDITKPDPNVFDYFIIGYGLSKEEIIFVGDSIVDLLTAKNANVKFIGVETGSLKRKVFRELGVEEIVPTVASLPKYLGM